MFAELLGFRVGYVAELLDSGRKNLGGENAVLVIDISRGDPLKHPPEAGRGPPKAMQSLIPGKNLNPILHTIRHPDVAIAIDGGAANMREIPAEF